MEKEIRAVAYARVNSKEQADKELSIPAQLEAIRNYCKQKGWKLMHEYIDAGKSAKTDERPEFQRMVAMAKRQNRNFDTIIVHKVDRFSRNRDDHVIYKSLLKKLGVSVHSVTEQTDPETPHGFLMEGIMEVISEFYNMNLKTETMKGMRENAKRGFHNGGYASYGYRLSKVTESSGNTKTILVPGPDDEVGTVKRIFHNYVYDGYGYKKIASLLNEERIPSPSGEQWSYSSIHSMLHNEAYIGNKVWNKHDYSAGKTKKSEDEWIRLENTHIALVSQEVFNLVPVRSKTRIKNSNFFEAANTPYVLRGLFKCPFCGSNMVSGQSGGCGQNRNIRRYYICGLYQRKGKSVCKFKSFNKELIENCVINILLREFTMFSLKDVLQEEIIRFASELTKEQRYKLNTIEKEIEMVNLKLSMLNDSQDEIMKITNSKKYIEEYNTQLNELILRKQVYVNEIETNEIDIEVVEIIRNKLIYFINNIKTESPDKQNLMLKEFVSTINYNIANNTITIKVVFCNPNSREICLFSKTIVAVLK